MKPTHLDLFSGIGGFALAAGWAGFETIGFSEIDEYASAVLRKHWPGVPNYGDIKNVTKEALANAASIRSRCENEHGQYSSANIKDGIPLEFRGSSCHLANSIGAGLEIGQEQPARQEQQAAERSGNALPDARCWGGQVPGRIECGEPEPVGRFAQSRLGRVVDGVSAWPHEPDIPRVCTGTKNRQARLKALGNAIVPQVAFQILKAMNQSYAR